MQLLMAVLLTVCLSTETTRAGQKQKVFVVKSKNLASYNLAVEGFRHRASSEWTIVEYDLQGALENTEKLVKRLKKEKPDLVVAVGAKALTALVQSKVSRPMVFCMVMNPAAHDMSSCDVTGVSLAISRQEQIEVLKELKPEIKKVGVLLRKSSSPDLLDEANKVAAKNKVKIIPIEIENEKQIPHKLRPVLGKVDALCMLDDAFIHSKETLEYVVLKSIENNLPFMAVSRVFVKEGALLSLSPSFFGNGQQAAEVADKILTGGIKARSIPVSVHKKPELAVNLKIARKMHLDIPPALLYRAKNVYE